MDEPFGDVLRFAVLGPVRAWRFDEELDLGSPQQRMVLAVLLLRRGRIVAVDELVDAVWGDRSPAAAVSVLRTYVSRLRKVLEPERKAGAAARILVSAGSGYMVQIPDDAVDLGLFGQRVAQARALQAEGDTAAASELLHAALDSWGGTPLAGFSGLFAEQERFRLSEQRLSALEACIEIDVQLGQHGEVIGDLTRLTQPGSTGLIPE
ncbi:AfsR/SARP family transcriptional regulator [Streptomyces sp. NRRL S-813]|uniref:AfsR/SARP family transcriptional regulator n=1 Tax=Streptomyces sp. NRRL S-813 TaxID=1463919 RepID=UPI0004C12920|nr:BTAD domain-containing putative transcriptional regulator [Streptomyces sp. NRRL S-813]